MKIPVKMRHGKRQIWIFVTPENNKSYIDEDVNIQIKQKSVTRATKIVTTVKST